MTDLEITRLCAEAKHEKTLLSYLSVFGRSCDKQARVSGEEVDQTLSRLEESKVSGRENRHHLAHQEKGMKSPKDKCKGIESYRPITCPYCGSVGTIVELKVCCLIAWWERYAKWAKAN